jgi:peptide/nickel transport system permease protein
VFWKELWNHKSARIGLILFTVVLTSAIFANWISPFDPVKDFDNRNALTPPNREYLLGTDNIGRDQLSRLLHGARISLLVGFAVESVAVLLGITVGLLSGYYGGKVDDIASWLINLTQAFPGLLLAIATMAVLGPGLVNIIVALALVSWPSIARLVRGEVLRVREQEFVTSAKVIGAGDLTIMVRHILPNCLAPVWVAATLGMASAILDESALSFLGLGVQSPNPSWGSMLGRGRDYLSIAPWLTTYPGLCILITVLGLNLLGDGLRDLFDPRMKGSSKSQK